MKFKIISIIVILVAATALLSCRTRKSPAQKRAYKMEKQMKKENQQMVEDYYEHHYNIQPVETQQMMKNSKKRAKKINKGRQSSWVDRTFKRRRSKSCNGN